MVIQKTAVYKVLAIVLALVLLVGSSERVEAADLNGSFDYSGYTIYYTFTNRVNYGSTVYDFTSPVYICIVQYGKRFLMMCLSTQYFEVNGSAAYTRQYGDITYYEYSPMGSYSGSSWSIPVISIPATGNDDRQWYGERFREYFLSTEFDDLLFSPDWHATGSDPIYQINNLQADIVDGNIVVTWEPQLYLPYKLMDHLYIRFAYAARTPGTVTTTAGRNRYLDIDAYAKMSDCGITIPLTDLTLLGDRYVSSLLATPYYYVGDNLEKETKKGQNTLVYFDELGVSSAPIIVDPEVKEEIPEENVNQNIFSVITNFFGGFFRNLLNTIKTAIIPESADLLALLQDMNDWFSERFGFIWYPFDLAIDIVAAFALGEPDSKITVPEFTINILGGIKLWDAFVVDLDPIDFLKYVRFFTSTIMCCGTVSLAIRKWDEWIGGEH